MGETRNRYKISFGKPDRKTQIGGPIKPKYWRKTRSYAILFTINSAWTDLGLKPSLCDLKVDVQQHRLRKITVKM
jgi:hypothetical protein